MSALKTTFARPPIIGLPAHQKAALKDQEAQV